MELLPSTHLLSPSTLLCFSWILAAIFTVRTNFSVCPCQALWGVREPHPGENARSELTKLLLPKLKQHSRGTETAGEVSQLAVHVATWGDLPSGRRSHQQCCDIYLTAWGNSLVVAAVNGVVIPTRCLSVRVVPLGTCIFFLRYS